MTLTNLNSTSLRNLIKLTERKEALVREIEKIEGQLSSLILGKPLSRGKRRGRPAKSLSSTKINVKAGKPAKRAKRGALKTKIYAALRAAGDAGMKVPDLSKKIGVKSQNVHVWFSSTGKKLPEIKRIGKGHFKLLEKATGNKA
ncbi:MAG: hypothetical protein WCP60_09885 [bacterium]